MEEITLSSSLSSTSSVNCNVRKKNSIAIEDGVDSIDNNYQFHGSKRLKHDQNCGGLVQKHKGVVLQHNGNWGAQIYANHQRIWLGTFKSYKEAVMAYDSAAIKLRSRVNHNDHQKNLPWTDQNYVEECKFQNCYSVEAILKMKRDGSYESKFDDFVTTSKLQMAKEAEADRISLNFQGRRVQYVASCDRVIAKNKQHLSLVQLFQKELTPSDVGKLNRLVIPKKFASKYFPCISEDGDNNKGNYGTVDDIQLVFYDKLMKGYTFRYCYWRSSQSFVFTRGWNKFVKDKNLKEKDIVTFYSCVAHENQERVLQDGATCFALIDITYGNNHYSEVDERVKETEGVHKELELELKLGQSVTKDELKQQLIIEGTDLKGLENVLSNLRSEDKAKGNGMKLFGVRIN